MQKVIPMLSSVLVLIGFSWPRVSGSTSETSLGACSTLGMSPRLLPPHSVGKQYTNSPPSKNCYTVSRYAFQTCVKICLWLEWHTVSLLSNRIYISPGARHLTFPPPTKDANNLLGYGIPCSWAGFTMFQYQLLSSPKGIDNVCITSVSGIVKSCHSIVIHHVNVSVP